MGLPEGAGVVQLDRLSAVGHSGPMHTRRIGDLDVFPIGMGCMQLSGRRMLDHRDRAIATIFRHGNDKIFPLFLKTAGEICEGEVREISEKKNINMTEEAHLEIVRKKTASFLACALQTGALIWGIEPGKAEALGRFGTFFGMAFQLIDDCLDFTGEEREFGKTLGSDLEEGVYTLPVIHCLASGERDKVVRILYSRSHNRRFSMLREALEKSGALDYAMEKAREFIAMAKRELEVFPPSEFRASLDQLAGYVLERKK